MGLGCSAVSQSAIERCGTRSGDSPKPPRVAPRRQTVRVLVEEKRRRPILWAPRLQTQVSEGMSACSTLGRLQMTGRASDDRLKDARSCHPSIVGQTDHF